MGSVADVMDGVDELALRVGVGEDTDLDAHVFTLLTTVLGRSGCSESIRASLQSMVKPCCASYSILMKTPLIVLCAGMAG